MSRMTIVTSGSDDVIEQINKQLDKLVEVVAVIDMNEGDHLERELMLVKVRAVGAAREEDRAHGRYFLPRHIIDVTDKSYTIELTGAVYKLDSFSACHQPQPDPGNRAHRRIGRGAQRQDLKYELKAA